MPEVARTHAGRISHWTAGRGRGTCPQLTRLSRVEVCASTRQPGSKAKLAALLRLDSSSFYKAWSRPPQTIPTQRRSDPSRVLMSSANDAVTLDTNTELEKVDDNGTIATAIPASERGTGFWLVFFAICLALFVSALDAVSIRITIACLTRANSLMRASPRHSS